jgi:hypothetical protein
LGGNRHPSSPKVIATHSLANQTSSFVRVGRAVVVKNYLRIIFDKLGVWNRLELALWYEARRYESPTYVKGDRAMV